MPKRKSTRKRKRKIVHTASAHLSVDGLTRAGSALELCIFAEGQKIGEIRIGRGGLFWFGCHRQTGKRVSWTRFAKIMDELTYN